jgi:hypothetical protein
MNATPAGQPRPSGHRIDPKYVPVVSGDRHGTFPVPQHRQVAGDLDLPEAGGLLPQPGGCRSLPCSSYPSSRAPYRGREGRDDTSCWPGTDRCRAAPAAAALHPPVVSGDRRGIRPVPQHRQVAGVLDLPEARGLLPQPGGCPVPRAWTPGGLTIRKRHPCHIHARTGGKLRSPKGNPDDARSGHAQVLSGSAQLCLAGTLKLQL